MDTPKQPLDQQEGEQLRKENASLRCEIDRLRRLAQSSADGIWCLDTTTNLIDFTTSWGNALGYSQNEYPHYLAEFEALIHQDDLPLFRSALKHCGIGINPIFEVSVRVRNKNGKYRNLLFRGSAFRTDDGTGACIGAACFDVTTTMEQLLTYELIFNSIPHLIFVKDSHSTIRWANRAALDFYGGRDLHEMIGKSDSDYNADKSQVMRFRADEQKVINNRKVIHIERETNTDARGNTHYLNTIKFPLLHPDGRVSVVVVATFIDEVVRLTRLQQTRENLTLVAGKLSHKLNTRIATVETMVIALSGVDTHQLNEILKAVNDLKVLGGNFLTLTVSGVVKREHTNLVSVLCNGLLQRLNQHVSITINGQPLRSYSTENRLYDMYGDSAKLSDAFRELLNNAIEAVEGRPAAISIRLKHSPLPKQEHSKRQKLHPEQLIIHFSDNGPGISPKIRHRLFQPFNSGKTTGTGLGLAIVREVISAHDGAISLIPTEGKGTCFEIVLPTKM